MASLFGHALTSIALGNGFSKTKKNLKFWILGIFCAVLPDADVISFKLGIPYASFWGHRGFTHSFVFAIILGLIITLIFYRKMDFRFHGNGKKLKYFLFFTLCTASHSLLDALTNGGLGVAFFAPFNNSRYFFPWRPILVSPIGIENFFGARGLRVIKSELLYIGLPSLVFIVFMKLKNRFIK